MSSIKEIIHGNIATSGDGRYATAVFSIGFGQYGATVLLIGIYLLLSHIKYYDWIFGGIFIIVGLLGVVFSGSRGPFIATFICLFAYLLSFSRRKIVILIAAGVVFLLWQQIGELMFTFNDYLNKEGYHVFDRVVNSVFAPDGLGEHTNGRDRLYDEAIDLFLDNPLFGSSYLIPGKIYVHNILIEQFMATGIFGGICFLLLNIIVLLRGWKIMCKDHKYAIIPVLYLQYFIYGCLSVTIIALFPYWLFMLLTLNKYETNSCYKAW